METAAVKRKKLVEQLTVLDQAAAQLKELKTIKEERESQLAEAKDELSRSIAAFQRTICDLESALKEVEHKINDENKIIAGKIICLNTKIILCVSVFSDSSCRLKLITKCFSLSVGRFVRGEDTN